MTLLAAGRRAERSSGPNRSGSSGIGPGVHRAPRTPKRTAPPSRSFRPDIEGLRALAVGSVLLNHAGLAWTPGGFAGVDVFLVISGFLITSMMARELAEHGRLGLADFWARRARRLLPASSVVLVFSGLVSLLWLPATSRQVFGGDIAAAAGYVVNWRLAFREVDYLAEQVGPSPVQHYWSLAVEEQFYVVWPILAALLAALVRHRWRAVLLVVLVVATTASFAFTLSYAVAQPGLAFFVSTTRVWELGVGALLALALPWLLRIPAAVRGVLGWAGGAAVVSAILLVDSSTRWPGPATLLPVLGTAAAILAGAGRTVPWGVGRVLGLRPAVWIGALSYSLYLWHWPLLVAAEGIWGDLRVRQALLVVAVSVVPAWLSYRYLETPLRHSPRLARPRPALLAGAFGTAVAAVAGVALVASYSLVDTAEVATAAEAPGARALQDPRYVDTDWAAVRRVDHLRPSPLETYRDLPRIYADRCVAPPRTGKLLSCEYGDPDADRTVVLVGDSKAAQWFTPVEAIAEREGWRLIVIAKNGCLFADSVLLDHGQRNENCEAWSRDSLSTVEELRPDVVLTVTRPSKSLPPGGETSADYEPEAMADGLVHHWERVAATGARIVPILDTPVPSSMTIPDCVQENLDDLTACTGTLADGVPRSGAEVQRAAAERVPGTRVVDMTSVVCPDGVHCPAVIGGVVVYRAGTHLSDSFVESTTEVFAARLAEATDGLLGARTATR
ncbi:MULTISPECIES: acyltransferase family protein [unclassified Nocardioides]|uniref:acyltransferase family protein n=1 Tax=unclassified Nocardioides TaxID=2615069 RepID=UPI0030145B45